MELVIRVHILSEDFCIIRHINALGKGMNPSVLLSQLWVKLTVFYSLSKETSLGKGKVNSNQLYSAKN